MGKAFKWLLDTVAKAFVSIFVHWLWTVWGAFAISGLSLIVLYYRAHPLPAAWFDRALGASAALLLIAILSTIGRYLAERPLKSNLVVECGRIKYVCLDTEGRWTHFTGDNPESRSSFVAEFSNRPHPKHRVEEARDVRAKVTINPVPAKNQMVRVDPTPWLNAWLPNVSFESGVSHELLLALLDYDVDPETRKPRVVIFGMRDNREYSGAGHYEPTAQLMEPAVATVTLTVDGILKGPFYFHLDPGDPPNKVLPKCVPFVPPGVFVRLAAQLPYWIRGADG